MIVTGCREPRTQGHNDSHAGQRRAVSPVRTAIPCAPWLPAGPDPGEWSATQAAQAARNTGAVRPAWRTFWS